MAAAKLIVCEKSGAWAVALRREFGADEVRVYETRSLAECGDELRLAPASFLVCSATAANAANVCDFLVRLAQRYPDARAVVAANADAADYAELFREGGALAVVTSARELRGVANLIRRHFQRFPAYNDSFRTQLWSRLPWTESNSAGVAGAVEAKKHRPLSK